MKKTALLALAILLILATMTGCDVIKTVIREKHGVELGEKSEEKIPFDGAKIEYISSTPESLTVRIRNDSRSTWQSGNMKDYHLEIEKDGEWYIVTQKGEFANTMELMIFAPGDEITHTFSFTDRYGKLSPGRYRVVKSWWANAAEGIEAGEFHLVCEFTVE